MSKSRSVIMGLFFITLVGLLLNLSQAVLLTSANTAVAAKDEILPSAQIEQSNRTQVTLSAPYSTISWDDRDPGQERFDLPLLYLRRQRGTTSEGEHTLQIAVSDLPGGMEVQIQIVSEHEDVATGARYSATERFRLPEQPCTADAPCILHWTLDASTLPSDLYHLYLKDADGYSLWSNPKAERPDFVALDTWDVAIGDYAVRITYATLFPFAKGPEDATNRLPAARVTDFIEGTFVPMVIETWYTQVEEWGFGPIYPAWDADKLVEVFITAHPWALFDGTGTYTVFYIGEGQPYPERRIWWFSSNRSFERYDTLENGVKVTFSHEFFHLMQLNVRLGTGRPANLWLNLFIEGQGRFAPSVQYPEMELHTDHLAVGNSAYINSANLFLAHELSTSFRDLESDPTRMYVAAAYWRFLYEQYGDMAVIRAALEEMALHYQPDIVGSMADVMDSALARSDGPFHTFEASWIAFAGANYALRVANGRRVTLDVAVDGAYLYDPERMYVEPPLAAELAYSGVALTHSGAVPSSYGTDLLEVTLDRSVQGQGLTVRFRAEGSQARFSVQIWKLGPGYAKPSPVTSRPESLPQNADGSYSYFIPQVDRTVVNRLALIITRLDPDETADPLGGYAITLEPAS